MTTHPQPPQSPQSFDEFWDKYAVKDDWLYQGTYRTGLKATWEAASAAKQVEIDELKAENERLTAEHDALKEILSEDTARELREALVAADALAEAAKLSAELAPRVPNGNEFNSGWTIANPVVRALARYLEARKSDE